MLYVGSVRSIGTQDVCVCVPSKHFVNIDTGDESFHATATCVHYLECRQEMDEN